VPQCRGRTCGRRRSHDGSQLQRCHLSDLVERAPRSLLKVHIRVRGRLRDGHKKSARMVLRRGDRTTFRGDIGRLMAAQFDLEVTHVVSLRLSGRVGRDLDATLMRERVSPSRPSPVPVASKPFPPRG